jgi:hypothetical protein
MGLILVAVICPAAYAVRTVPPKMLWRAKDILVGTAWNLVAA